jgi:hypothetical protein
LAQSAIFGSMSKRSKRSQRGVFKIPRIARQS